MKTWVCLAILSVIVVVVSANFGFAPQSQDAFRDEMDLFEDADDAAALTADDFYELLDAVQEIEDEDAYQVEKRARQVGRMYTILIYLVRFL